MEATISMRVAAVAGLFMAAGAGAPAVAQSSNSACIGQLMLFGGNFCPQGYVEAAGETLPIQGNTALYSLYGTAYGGDGRTLFGVPDLRGRAPVGQGQGPGLPYYSQGQLTGSTTTTVTQPNLPPTSPTVNAFYGPGALSGTPENRYLGQAQSPTYATGGTATKMAPGVISPLGNGVPMTTQSPIQAIRWCVAVQGIYCSRQ